MLVFTVFSSKAHTGSALKLEELKYNSALKRFNVKDIREKITSIEELFNHYEIARIKENRSPSNTKGLNEDLIFFREYLSETINDLKPPFVLIQNDKEILVKRQITLIRNFKNKYNPYMN